MERKYINLPRVSTSDNFLGANEERSARNDELRRNNNEQGEDGERLWHGIVGGAGVFAR